VPAPLYAAIADGVLRAVERSKAATA